jgi:hypothetical protein
MDAASLPYVGVGVGYRPEMHELYAQHGAHIDWLELIADRFLEPESLERIGALARDFRLIPHGLEMSVGTDAALDEQYLEDVAHLVRALDAPHYSDHLCMTKAVGPAGVLELGTLVPLPFTETMARRCAAKARHIQDRLGVPFLLENITYPFALPGDMSEADFIRMTLEEADCGLLLDLTNVFINSQNHGYDPLAFLDALPLERAVQVHLAGGVRAPDGEWHDSHSHSVSQHPQVWELLEFVVQRAPLRGVLLERDQNFPADLSEIVDDLARARAVLRPHVAR